MEKMIFWILEKNGKLKNGKNEKHRILEKMKIETWQHGNFWDFGTY